MSTGQHSATRTGARRGRGWIAALVALAMTLFAFAGPSHAATGEEIPGAITNVYLQCEDTAMGGTSTTCDMSKPITKGQTRALTLEWAVPNSAREGDWFSITLPTELAYDSTSSFNLRNAKGDLVAVATAEKVKVDGKDTTKVTFTLQEFVNTHFGVQGTAWFSVKVNAAPGESTLTFGELTATVDVAQTTGGTTTTYTWAFQKSGSDWNRAKQTLNWKIYPPVGDYPVTAPLVVVDTLPPGQEFNGNPTIQKVALTKNGDAYQYTSASTWTTLKSPAAYAWVDTYDTQSNQHTRTYTFKVPLTEADGIRITQPSKVVGDLTIPSMMLKNTVGVGGKTATGSYNVTTFTNWSGSKSGSFDKASKLITWTINVPGGVYDELTVTDTLGANQEWGGAPTVYSIAATQDLSQGSKPWGYINAVKTALTQGVDYKIVDSVSGVNLVREIVFLRPVENEVIQVVQTSRILNDLVTKVTNSAAYNGKVIKANAEVRAMFAGGTGLGTKGMFSLIKTDSVTEGRIAGAQFQLYDAEGVQVGDVFTVGADEPYYSEPLPAGKYTLVEVKAPDHYVAYGKPIDVMLEVGEVTDIDVPNDRIPTLTLTKTVLVDGGATKVPGDFWLRAVGSEQTVEGYSGSNIGVEVKPGVYALDETQLDGFDLASLTCKNNGVDADMPTSTSVKIGWGDNVTCTWVNDDKNPELTFTKHVTNNDGGAANAADWKLLATKLDENGDKTQTVVEIPHGQMAALTGGVWSVVEQGPDGYHQVEATCTGGSSWNSVTQNLTVTYNQQITCDFYNDDIAPRLILRKAVVNSDEVGGAAVANDWTLTATADKKVVVPVEFANGGFVGDTDEPQKAQETDAGWYTLEEFSEVTGYELTNLVCELKDPASGTWRPIAGVDPQHPRVDLGLDQDVACLFTNTDQPAHLQLDKVVDPVNGRINTADEWLLSADGPSPIVEGTTGVRQAVLPGEYLLTEAGPAGWVQRDLTCRDDDTNAVVPVTTDLAGNKSVAVALGQSVTCTFVNTDLPDPTLQLRKAVVNDDDGEAVAADWLLTATPIANDVISMRDGDAAQRAKAVSYVLGEDGPEGYDLASLTCVGLDGPYELTGDGDTIAPRYGDQVVCTFTNDDEDVDGAVLADNPLGEVLASTGGQATLLALAALTMLLFGVVGVRVRRQRHEEG